MNLVEHMRLFVRIVELNSFRKAALEFEVTPPVATRSIAILEAHLGAKLLLRTTRTMQLTSCGSRYFEYARSWLSQLDDLDATIQYPDVTPRGTLRIALAKTTRSSVISSLLNDFAKSYPKLKLELSVVEHRADLRNSIFDLAIAPGVVTVDSHFVVHSILDHPLICVAAPTYLMQRGMPTNPSELLNHPHISFQSDADDPWLFQSDAGHSETYRFQTRYKLACADDALNAVLIGMGFTFLRREDATDELDRRNLFHLLPNHVVANAADIMSVIVPEKKAMCPAVCALVNFAQNYTHKTHPILVIPTSDLDSIPA